MISGQCSLQTEARNSDAAPQITGISAVLMSGPCREEAAIQEALFCLPSKGVKPVIRILDMVGLKSEGVPD